jgi:glycosyltransferase involved in cell wall biosynthesis
MSRIRVAIFVDVFPPNIGGGATRAFHIAKNLATLNCDVIVITGGHIYPGGGSLLTTRSSYERFGGIDVYRVPSLKLPFKGLLNRLLNYVVCCIFMLMKAAGLKGVNLVFSLGMHPFTDVGAYLVKLINPKSYFIIDFSDVFADNSLYYTVGNAINKILLRISDSITVHNERMKTIFIWRYRYTKKMSILYNAVDTDVFRPINEARKEKQLLSRLCGRSLKNKVVVCYFGVLGPFQGLDKVLKAAFDLQEELREMIFCVIGDGEKRSSLERLASNLKNVFLFPPMPRDMMPFIAAEADVGLVPLVSSNYSSLVYVNLPTKAAEFLSSGTPVLAAKGTFIGYLVTKWNAGYEVDFNSAEDICNCLRHIYNNSKEIVMKSTNARSLALNVFSSNVLRESLSSLLAGIGNHGVC